VRGPRSPLPRPANTNPEGPGGGVGTDRTDPVQIFARGTSARGRSRRAGGGGEAVRAMGVDTSWILTSAYGNRRGRAPLPGPGDSAAIGRRKRAAPPLWERAWRHAKDSKPPGLTRPKRLEDSAGGVPRCVSGRCKTGEVTVPSVAPVRLRWCTERQHARAPSLETTGHFRST
jgi:hypothetical protein